MQLNVHPIVRPIIESHPLQLIHWLNRRSGTILLTGIAASLAVNALAYRRDRAAARRLRMAAIPPALPETLPRISFLVPAWNEAQTVEACILSILALRYPHKELVLCAGGRDATLAICQPFAGDGVTVLQQQPGEGKQGALRRCFENSHGEILFLTDADCVVDDGCVEATLAPLILEQENAATGYWQPFESDKDQPFVAYQWANHLRYQAAMPDWAGTLDGRNSAIRREALVAAGAFKNAAATGTDYVLSQELKRAGYRIRSVLDSRVQTKYPIEITEYLNQGSRWYRNRLVQGIRYQRWQDVTASLWAAGASLFMLAGPLALLLSWRAAGFAWLAGVAHLGLTQARLADFSCKAGGNHNRLPRKVIDFIAFTLISDLAMVKGLLASLDRRQRKTW